ncbi:MAG: ubiquinol-cytochrome C chaperone family protein [Rhodospirillaceae bacterium]
MMVFLKRLFLGSGRKRAVARCYALVVEQSRRPGFYLWCGIPDSLDGRYEMLALHAFLVVHRLKGQGEAARLFSRDFFEGMITEMDCTVREMGVGDMGVPPRVKRMVKGFNGRIVAYDRGIAGAGDDALLAALDNNLFGTVLEPAPEALARMAGYLRQAVAVLEAQPLEALLAGEVCFPDPPPGDGGGAS